MKQLARYVLLFAIALAGCGGERAATQQAANPPAESQTEPTAASDGVVAISVTEDGFVPATVTVPVGKPVTLVVTRKTAKTCATELVMKEQNIDQPLPLDTPVEITFTPTQRGELTYACAMDMYKGKVIVK